MAGGGNNTKCLANMAAIVILQAAIILILAFTAMRVREVTIKNTNFGGFEYANGTMSLAYNGTVVGDAAIAKGGRAKARDTAKFNMTVDVTSSRLTCCEPWNGHELRVLTLKGDTKVRGKVKLLKVMKRKNSIVMDCALSVNLATCAMTTKCK
ncbi:hypothetical protein ACJRO7_018320 [Eucalyptus globulus]|uniref:Late embryogenesis abundant protein LEA-2 subgroup domain-containing protein n=1 Tax=Eucalyptus globulus TaxID=34317 RepID=A0ABD3L499_EUCGL